MGGGIWSYSEKPDKPREPGVVKKLVIWVRGKFSGGKIGVRKV